MQTEDKQEFVRVLNGMAAIKRVDLTKEAYEMWWASMVDWSIEEFRATAGYLLKNREFMPSPYDFEQVRQLEDSTAQEAWSEVIAYCAGGYRQGDMGNNRIDAVVAALGGYQTIALMPTDQLGFVQRRFVDMYDNFRQSDATRKELPHLDERTTNRLGEPESLKAITERIHKT